MKKRLFSGVIFSISLFLLLLGGINLPQLNNIEEPIDSSPPSEERLEYIENEWLLQVESYEEALTIALDNGLILKSVSDYGIAVFYGDLNHSSQPLYYKEKVDFQRNYLYYTQEVVINDPEAPNQFALDHLDAYNAWTYSLGDGVLVAVIDTGIEATHDEFQGKISPLSYNSSYQNVGIEFVGDDVGHGTMVAGVIAATQNNSIGISGIAPEADLMVIKANIDNEGMFSGDSIAEALYYATDNGADIINMSLGGSYADPIMEAACDYAYNAGVIVVAAAGNDGLPILGYPASFSSVISVGATTSTKEKAQFSNYNRYVDISAPGQDIYTTIMGNTYGGVSGTSFSSPYVAGVIALLKSYYLTETNDMILNYLYASTEDLGTFGKDSLYGYGLANAHDAMTITLRQVTLDTGLGSPIAPKYVAEGRPFYINDRPLLDGHYFAGWYKDETLLERYDFANEVIYTDITLYAKYEVGESTFPDDYEFLVNSDDTVTILSYFGPGGVVSVPNEIYGLPVVEISGGAFIFNNNVTELVIPDSVVSIGDYAFAYMDGVISINVGAGVVNLGEAVFGASPTLTSVEITSTLFSYLPDHSFESSTSLTSVILPSTITELGRNAFYNTISLQNFTFPASLKIIGNNAFGNSGIQSAILPEGLEHIHSSAFSYAFNLNTIYFGESLTTIGNQAFLGCREVENVSISSTNPQFTIFMDVLYTKDYSTLVWYLPYNSLETFTMPNNVYHLASSAFSNARFEYFVFNGVVTEIPETAFYEAENLKEIVIPDNVKTIGVEAFKRAYALESVVLPKDLEKIPAGMFDRCIALKNVVFPENLKIVGASAFVSSGVEKIILPETVETLEGWAFHACYFLKEIYVPDGVKIIGDIALSTAPIEQIYPNVEFIGISGIPIANMEEIIYPASLTVLSKQTTDGYHSLTRKIDFGSAKDIYLDLKQGSKVQELVINAATETFLLEGLSLYKIHTYFYGMNTTISMPISEMMVIHAYEGSSAHQYAIDHGLTFYSLTRDVINHNVTININGPATVIDGYPALVQDQELLHFKLDVAENNMVYSVMANGKYLTNANRSYWVNVVEDLVIDIVIKPNDYLLEYSNFTIVDQEIVQTLTNAERINYPSVDEFDNQIIGLKELDGHFVINSELYNSHFANLYNSAYDILHISFPEHVTHIPFLDNIYGSLETVDIPEGVSTMSGFEGLGKLKYLVLPSTLSEFPHWIDTNDFVRGTMTYCGNLEYVIIKSYNVDAIPDYAFYNAYSLKHVLTSDLLNHVGDYAFYNAVSFKEIIFHNPVSAIEDTAFMFFDYGYYYMSISPYGDFFNKLPNLRITSEATGPIDYASLYGIDNSALSKYYVAYSNDDLPFIYMETVILGGDAVYSGIPKKSPDGELMYVFTGWDRSLTGISHNNIAYPNFMAVLRAYEVKFIDPYTKEAIGYDYVYSGSPAIAPENTDRPTNLKYTYQFIGWNKDFSNVTTDMVVEAIYERTLVEYQVTFYDWDNQVLEIQQVGYGQAAIEPVLPYKENYTFKKWSADITNITEDIDVYPIREQRQFQVIFYDFYGNYVTQQEVYENEAAIPPELGEIGGYVLIGWSEDIENVTQPLQVYPIYAQTESRLNLVMNEVEEINIVDIQASAFATMILDANNRLYGIGNGSSGELGNPAMGEVNYPVDITDNFPLHEGEVIVKAYLGNTNSLILTSENRVFASGRNDYGQLGRGDISYHSDFPVEITQNFIFATDEVIIDAAIYNSHIIVCTSMGRVFAWGNNDLGQLGTGDTTSYNIPWDITGNFFLAVGEVPESVGVGDGYSGLLTSAGRVFLWGYNSGQLADGTFDYHYAPNDVTANFALNPLEKITSMELSYGNGFAITSENRVFAWGGGYYGNLTTGQQDHFPLPTDVTWRFGLETGELVETISLGNLHGYALTSNNRLLAWGNNSYGQMGNGIRSERNPVIDITQHVVNGSDQIVTVEAGYYGGFVLTTEGKFYGFGSNNYSQIGNYSKYDVMTPTLITFNNTDVQTIVYYYGDEVILPTPTKITHNFAGWYYDFIMPIETDFTLYTDKTLYPKWEIKTFNVQFYNYDGTLLKEEVVGYGSDAIAPVNPTKPSTPQYNYVFDGWDLSFVNVTDDLVITALFTEEIRYYIVNFYDYDGTLLKSESVIYGSNATAPTDPVREANPEFTYTFDGWIGDYSFITGNTYIYTLFTAVEIEFIVRYYDAEGLVIKEETVKYGEDSTPPVAPVKESEVFYSYDFLYWSRDYLHITEDLDIYPVYESIAIVYEYELAPGVDTVKKGEVWEDQGIVYNNQNISYTVTGTVDTDIINTYEIYYTIKVGDTTLGYLTRIVRIVATDEVVIITLNPGIATLTVGQTYIEAGATTNKGTIVTSGSVDTTKAGVYLVSYTVTYFDQTYVKYRFIIVYSNAVDLTNINALIPAVYRKEDEE